MATDKQKQLRVSWIPKRAWSYAETEYTILYHSKHDMKNKVCCYCIQYICVMTGRKNCALQVHSVVPYNGKLPCETEVPCSFFSVRDERNLCSQPHDFLLCMCELRQHLSRETPLPVLETKHHFLLFHGNSLRQLWSKKTSVCWQLLFLR